MHQKPCAKQQTLPKAGIVAVLLHCHELHSIIALLGYAGEDVICHSNQASECCRDQAAKLTRGGVTHVTTTLYSFGERSPLKYV